MEGYTTTVTQEGVTFTVTNTPKDVKPEEPFATGVIPVQKRITGDQPTVKSDFTFVLMAKMLGNPMPAGSLDNVKELTVSGAGTGEFGPIYFSKAGVYEYAVSEKYGGVTGYTYDTTVYTVRFDVSETEDGKLTAVRSILKSDGTALNAAEFTNPYKVPPSGPPILPQTGMLWWPVPVLLCAGLLSLLIGVMRRRRHG